MDTLDPVNPAASPAVAAPATGLLAAIETFCRQHKMAQSTFGRRAVNDGKFVARLRDGARVTPETLARVAAFMQQNGGTAPSHPPELWPLVRPADAKGAAASPSPTPTTPQKNFRFFDNRQKYLLFVSTCSEKEVVARRVGLELQHLHPEPPALRVFDAGMGDGTVLTRMMREMHRRFPTIPFYIVGKEISLEDVRLSLDKMADRFFEHPATVLVVTNMYYSEAPWLAPRALSSATSLVWHEHALTGATVERVLRADRGAGAVPRRQLAGAALAQDRQSRSTSGRSRWFSIARTSSSCSMTSSRARVARAPTTIS